MNKAAETVAKWETTQGFEPSEPQWVIGKNMELMLPQLEQHLFPQSNLQPVNHLESTDISTQKVNAKKLSAAH